MGEIPFAWRVKTPPADEPVSLALATAQCKQTTGFDVDLITQARLAARKWVEAESGRALMPQTLEGSLPRFFGRLWLPQAAPLSSLTHVKYYDASNVLTTLSSSVYTLPAFHEPALVKLATGQVWPATYTRDDAVQLEWVVGYANAAAAAAAHPDLIRAILLLIGHFDENRSAIQSGAIAKEIERSASDLCAQDKIRRRHPQDSEAD